MASKAIPSLNLATVYRNINKLVDEGQLIKFSHPSKGTFTKKQESHTIITFFVQIAIQP